MDGMIECTVTEDAGTRIAGQPVKPGDEIKLSQRNFDHYSMTGQVTTDEIEAKKAELKAEAEAKAEAEKKEAEAKAKADEAAKKKAEAEAAKAAKANAGD